MARFLGKNPHKKYVRQIPNRSIPHTIVLTKKTEEIEINENNVTETKDDMADERLEKIENIMGVKAPKRKVKVEKKDKGLIERTDNSTILLTEDNKMLLND